MQRLDAEERLAEAEKERRRHPFVAASLRLPGLQQQNSCESPEELKSTEGLQ